MPNNRIFEWFRFAGVDLATAEFLLDMRPQPLEQICYHCQQSAEKYLKGYLIHNGVEQPPKTHDLVMLCELCLEFDGRFLDIGKMCSALSVYSVGPRYPDELYIDEGLMEIALQYAREIKNFAPLENARRELESGAD